MAILDSTQSRAPVAQPSRLFPGINSFLQELSHAQRNAEAGDMKSVQRNLNVMADILKFAEECRIQSAQLAPSQADRILTTLERTFCEIEARAESLLACTGAAIAAHISVKPATSATDAWLAALELPGLLHQRRYAGIEEARS